jgi:hypothetical protein
MSELQISCAAQFMQENAIEIKSILKESATKHAQK